MTSPTKININNKSYFLIDDLCSYDPSYFVGVNRNLRGIINKKKISEVNYIYAYNKDNQWINSNKTYVRSYQINRINVNVATSVL